MWHKCQKLNNNPALLDDKAGLFLYKAGLLSNPATFLFIEYNQLEIVLEAEQTVAHAVLRVVDEEDGLTTVTEYGTETHAFIVGIVDLADADVGLEAGDELLSDGLVRILFCSKEGFVGHSIEFVLDNTAKYFSGAVEIAFEDDEATVIHSDDGWQAVCIELGAGLASLAWWVEAVEVVAVGLEVFAETLQMNQERVGVDVALQGSFVGCPEMAGRVVVGKGLEAFVVRDAFGREEVGHLEFASCGLSIQAELTDALIGLVRHKQGTAVITWHIADALDVELENRTGATADTAVADMAYFSFIEVDIDMEEVKSVGRILVAHHSKAIIAQPRNAAVVAWRNAHAADVGLSAQGLSSCSHAEQHESNAYNP